MDSQSKEDEVRITDIEVIGLSFPLPPEGQYRVGRSKRVKYDCLVVKVYTDEGITGIGETCLWVKPDALRKAIDHKLKARFVGRSPFDIEKLSIPTTDVAQNAGLAAIDVACWDIIGKATDTPVYRLLSKEGEYAQTLRGYASAGVFHEWYDRPEQLVDEALRWIDDGWTAFKMRMGTDWERSGVTVARFLGLMEKVAAAVDGRMDLMVDAGCRCRSVTQAVDIAKGLEQLGFLWFEEPLPRVPADYAALTSQVEIPITGGEGFVAPQQFAEFLAQGGYDIVQPDASRTGLTGWMKIAAMAERRAKKCVPHCWFNAVAIAENAHGVAAIPNRLFMEFNANYNPLKNEILRDPLVPERGLFHLPDKPGLGIELDEEATKRFPYVEGPQYAPLEFPE